MQPTKYIWMNGSLVEWENANVHVLTHAMHYGSGAFEGVRVYKTADGPAVFRLKEHMARLVYSSSALRMQLPFTEQQLADAVIELLKENKLEQGYIRPLAYYAYGVMGLKPRDCPVHVAIATWPWGAYLPHELVDIKISKYIRIHPSSTVADAKINGHYVNSIMASNDIRDTKYHEALFLDYKGNVAEGPGENFFMVKAGKLITPARGTILPGITRDTVIQIAKKFGIETIEESFTPDEMFTAEEAFYTGTAAEVAPIRSIDDRVFGNGLVGPITEKIKTAYLDTVYGRNPEFNHFLTYVER